MEKYLDDKDFNEIMENMVECWKRRQCFQKISPSSLEYLKETMNSFKRKYNLFTFDLLDAIVKYISKSIDDIVCFLFEMRYYIKGDENSIVIVKYIFENFSEEEIKKYKYYFHDKLLLPRSSEKWFEYINFLRKYNYDFIRFDELCQSHNTYATEERIQYLFPKYLEAIRKLEDLENENEKMKKKINELELHIRYMPNGDGYMEAKDHFETFRTISERK
jgi:hypothetical protein